MKRFVHKILFVIYLPVFLLACEEIPTSFETEDNLVPIMEFLSNQPERFSDFSRIAETGEVKDALRAYNPNGNNYTLFIPDNEAFARFFAENGSYSDLNDLLQDLSFVRSLARYHIVNSSIPSEDFPYGAMPDSSLSGDYLVVGYIQSEDSTYYKINSEALVINSDLRMSNGIIHVIDKVLQPVTFSGFEWLKTNPDFQIITELFELTGLNDTLEINNNSSSVKPPQYTLLVEADSIFNKRGIFSLQDLIELYGNNSNNFRDIENPIYQFAAYHIVEGSIFLADLEDGKFNYASYASLPVQINSGIDIRINSGVEIFDSVLNALDTSYTYIDYISLMVNSSNVQTMNGPIHFIDRVMKPFKPGRTRITFQFYEEPLIQEIRNQTGRYTFTDPTELSRISWSGTEELTWEKSSSSSEKASNKDYLEINGDFSVTYRVSKVLPGKYGIQLRADSDQSENATVQVFLDGRQIGGNLNLTTGGNSSNDPYQRMNLGIIEFGKFEEHTITVRALVPGRFIWDYIRFENDLSKY
jgi:uncharacterized surface protein with fasciclin (FAS1) repeats